MFAMLINFTYRCKTSIINGVISFMLECNGIVISSIDIGHRCTAGFDCESYGQTKTQMFMFPLISF